MGHRQDLPAPQHLVLWTSARTSEFWALSTNAHPKGDGQTDRVNQTLKQYLPAAYCNYQQDNWSELLLLAKFAYNNAPSETTGVSPFFANKGHHLNLAIHPKRDLASSRTQEHAVDLGELHEYLKTEMAEAQQRF